MSKTLKVILVPLSLLVALPFGLYFNAQRTTSFWDGEVTKLCIEEGRATVYEKMDITANEFNQLSFGKRQSGNSNLSSPEDENIYMDYESEAIYAGPPTIRKLTAYIKHKDDSRILGRQILHSRIGGDFPPGLGHPSSFGCADVAGFEDNLLESVLNIVNEGQ